MKTFDSIAILNFYTGTVQVYAVESDMDLEEIFDKLEIDKDECFWIFGVNNIFIDKYIKSLNIIDEIENPILNGISTFNGESWWEKYPWYYRICSQLHAKVWKKYNYRRNDC